MKGITFFIFDGDGVEVDSEWLAGGVEAPLETELGADLALKDLRRAQVDARGSLVHFFK